MTAVNRTSGSKISKIEDASERMRRNYSCIRQRAREKILFHSRRKRQINETKADTIQPKSEIRNRTAVTRTSGALCSNVPIQCSLLVPREMKEKRGATSVRPSSLREQTTACWSGASALTRSSGKRARKRSEPKARKRGPSRVGQRTEEGQKTGK